MLIRFLTDFLKEEIIGHVRRATVTMAEIEQDPANKDSKTGRNEWWDDCGIKTKGEKRAYVLGQKHGHTWTRIALEEWLAAVKSGELVDQYTEEIFYDL